MRGMKIIGYCLGGLILVVTLLLFAVSVFVNPNDFKGRIAQQVKASTGRDLILQGDIRLSVFPWIALELGPLSLGNPAGFGTDPFMSVQHAALRVKLLPLLGRKLEVGRIEIDGLDLRMKKNAGGKGNWEDFGQKGAPAEKSGGSGSLQGLAGIRIKDSRISYDSITITHLNLDLGNVSQGAAVPLKAGFDLSTGPAGTSLSFTAAMDITLDLAARRLALASVMLAGEAQQEHGTSLPWKFQAPSVAVDLAAQTLSAPGFTAQAGIARLSGSLAGEQIVDAPAMSGSLTLAPVALREFMQQLGVVLPMTRDQKAFSSLAASSDYNYAHNTLQLPKLDIKLDESQLRGGIGITNLETRAVNFVLTVDHIDLDSYRPPEVAPPTTPSATATELPTASVRALNLHGEFSVGAAKVAGLALSGLHVSLQAQGGVMHASQLRASLYGGTYLGDVLYDVSEQTPRVTMSHQVSGVDMAALLKDGIKSTRLSGHGNARATLTGSGRTSRALIRDLNGRIEANLANGAVNGIDLWFEISRAQALVRQTALPAGSDDGRTKFDTFSMSADIAAGVATTKDLNIASPYLRVTGGGSSNLVSEAIDYHIVATLLKAPPSSQGADLSQLRLAGIPVEISGTISDPKVRPDLTGMLKSGLRQKLQDTLQDKLKDLLGH